MKKNKSSLCILIASKNDNYVDRLIERTSFVINYNLYLIANFSKEVDISILLVDWCSDNTLESSIYIPESISKKIRFLNIESKHLNKSSNPHEMHLSRALNAGLRRIDAEYTIVTGSDQIFSPSAVKNLSLFCEDSSVNGATDKYYLIPRMNLGIDLSKYSKSHEETSDYLSIINNSNIKYLNQKISTGSGIGGHLLKTSLFAKHKGFNEMWGGYGGTDVEFMARISQDAGHRDMSNIGVFLHKLPRTIGGSRIKRVQGKKFPKNYFNITKFSNDESWGLGSEKIDIISAINYKGKNSQIKYQHSLDVRNLQKHFSTDILMNFLSVNFIRIPSIQADCYLDIRLSFFDLQHLFNVIRIIDTSCVRTIWITLPEASKFLPILCTLFKDLSVSIIFGANSNNLNLNYERDINTLLRIIHSVGHYGNISIKNYNNTNLINLSYFLENKIFDVLLLINENKSCDNLFLRNISSLAHIVYKFKGFSFLSLFKRDGWNINFYECLDVNELLNINIPDNLSPKLKYSIIFLTIIKKLDIFVIFFIRFLKKIYRLLR